jgi:LysM repeat protein
MPSKLSPTHSWLRNRVLASCASVFAVSLFLPPYISDLTLVPPPDVDLESRGYLLAEDGFLMKTSSLTEQGKRSAFNQGIIHTVESGESIKSIAALSSLTPETILWANDLKKDATVKAGQKLLILPVDGILHEVKRGQNLQLIADLYDVPVTEIAKQNAIQGGYLLAGQELIIPNGKPIVEVVKPVIASKPPPKTGTIQPPLTVPPEVKSFSIAPSFGIFQMPCDCFYTQYYGSSHFGVDLQHRGGSPNFAAEAGTVTRAEYGWNGGYGNVIEIDHGSGLTTLYAHNKALYVQKGDKVTRGQAIAFMGNTGRVHGPTGIHLHFEVHVNGVKKNPIVYFK